MQQPDCRCMTHDTLVISWWSQSGSNRRPSRCKRDALPAELWPRAFETGFADAWTQFNLVGLGGGEPPTSPLSGVRSNQLSYRPPEEKRQGLRRVCPLGGRQPTKYWNR